MSRAPQTAAQKLGERLIIASILLAFIGALAVTGTHNKAGASEHSTATTLVPINVVTDAQNAATPVVHQSASKPNTTSAPTTAKPKVDDSPIVIVWNFPTCQHPNADKVAQIEKMQGPFTAAQVKTFVGCPA